MSAYTTILTGSPPIEVSLLNIAHYVPLICSSQALAFVPSEIFQIYSYPDQVVSYHRSNSFLLLLKGNS